MDIDVVIGRLAVSLVLGALGLLVYYSVDIYLVLTRRDFGNVNVQVMYFTRNDHGNKDRSRGDALLFRRLGGMISLREVYKNRVLFWCMIYFSRRATLEQPVLNFGKYSYSLLAPLRDIVLRATASMEFKRAAGLPFRQTRYQMLVMYGRSETAEKDQSKELKSYTLRVVLVREKDLKDCRIYLERDPPKIQTNLPLFKKIATAYNDQVGSFMLVNIVTA